LRQLLRSPLIVAGGLSLAFGYTAWSSHAASDSRRAAS